jgi:hypothetical protein
MELPEPCATTENLWPAFECCNSGGGEPFVTGRQPAARKQQRADAFRSAFPI